MRRAISMASHLALAGSLAVAASLVVAAAAVAQEDFEPPHPAHIHAGVCPQPGDVVAPLSDVTAGIEDFQGPTSEIAVEFSVTVATIALADILAGEHSINVHQAPDALDVYIACGDIGGPLIRGVDVAIGLAEQNASGHSGVALLHDNENGTTSVYVFLTRQASSGG